MGMTAGVLNPGPGRFARFALVAMTLIGGFPAKADPKADPNLDALLLNCRLADGSGKTVRIDPRLQQVQELDPVTGEVKNTITTSTPPAELGGGIIDDSTVKISEQEIQWSTRMYRPQVVAETHAINRQTLTYRGQTSIQRDGGPDIDELAVSGTCQRIQKLP